MQLKIQTHKIVAHRNTLRRSTRGDKWLLQYDVRPRTGDTGQALWLSVAEIPLPLILDYSLAHYSTEPRSRNETSAMAKEPDAAASTAITAGMAQTSGEASEAVQRNEDQKGGLEQGNEAEQPEEADVYCICRRGNFGRMVACDNEECQIEWFHFGCVGLKRGRAPKRWLCPGCKSLPGESIKWREE